MGRDETVLNMAADLESEIGFPFELEEISVSFKIDTPLHVVLNQECER